MWKRVALLCAALFLFVAGCSKAPRETAPPALSPSPLQAPTPGPQGPVFRAQDLFPRTDLALTYRFSDGSPAHETLLVDGNRFVQTIDGKPYVTWFLTEGGLLRPDPSDPTGKRLLRYLPAQLQDGLLWEQYAADDSYDFRLSQEERCDGDGISLPHCWKLEVINGVGLTTFHFAPGLGVVRATGEMDDVTDSFDKQLQAQGPARLPGESRQQALGMAPVFGAMQAPDKGNFREIAASGFQDLYDRHRKSPACGTPSSGKPVAPGASGRVTFLCAGKLFSLDLATGTQGLLYAHSSPIHDFAWAPTGRGLAFAAQVHQDAFYWDAATGKAHLIYPSSGEAMDLSWSSDGEILVASPGSSAQRGFDFVDRATGQVLGHSSGIRLSWSPVARRFATQRGVHVPDYATELGASRTLIVGDIVNGVLAERVIAEGTPEYGYSPAFFTADGTLVYEQFQPRGHKMVAWWSLPPGPGAQPAQLDVTSPLLAEVPREYATVGGKTVKVLGTSRDGQWSLIIFDRYDEVFLIRANLTGQAVRLPGMYHEWDPRR